MKRCIIKMDHFNPNQSIQKSSLWFSKNKFWCQIKKFANLLVAEYNLSPECV